MRISDWSSDVCSSDLLAPRGLARVGRADHAAIVIGMDRLGRPSRRERARRLLLPVVALPAYLGDLGRAGALGNRSEEHTSELQSLMRNSYAVFCLQKKKDHQHVSLANKKSKIMNSTKYISYSKQ